MMVDAYKIIESYILDFYRSIGLPVGILQGAYTNSSYARHVKIYPNKRVEHLAEHGKKYRTRKKNSKRALKIIAGGF